MYEYIQPRSSTSLSSLVQWNKRRSEGEYLFVLLFSLYMLSYANNKYSLYLSQSYSRHVIRILHSINGTFRENDDNVLAFDECELA